MRSARLQPMSSFAPSAAMVYTDLKHLRGITKPVDYGSGIEYADGILNSLFPESSVALQVSRLLTTRRMMDQF